MSGFIVSSQQALAWKQPSAQREQLGARGVFVLPRGATAGDVRAALRSVVQRHEILRTTVKDSAGLPLQFIGDEGSLPMPDHESAWSAAGWLASAHTGDAPLIACWSLSEEGPLLAVSISALHGDAVTLSQIAREVQGALRGQMAAQDPVQYADYAQWQREEESASGTAAADFWRQREPQVPTRLPLEVPTPGPFERITRAVPLASECTEHRALAAWAWLLSRHIDRAQWTLGLVVDGRSEEVADACGPYARVLPLPVRPPRDESWAAWQRALCAECDAVTAQAEFHSGAALPDQFVALTLSPDAQVVDTPVAYRLRLEALRTGQGLQLRIAANARRFSPTALQALADQLEALLATDWPAETRLNDLPLLSRNALQCLAQHGSEAALDSDEQTRLLPERIAEQARLHGERTAVYCNGRSLSYAELERRSSQLATRLVAEGAGPERIVAVCLQRSVDLLVALLGVMKAGAAYLPLDPTYPPERLAYMLQDSAARWLVMHDATAAVAPAGPSAIHVDQPDLPLLPATAAQPLPDQLAYLIYTSGSTGRPKGVAITHRNALHSTLARHRWYAHPVKAYLMLSSVAFDSSVAGVFWTLTQGGELIFPADGDHRDVAALIRLVQARQASHLLALPSLYAQLLQEPELLASIGTAIVAGEACPPSLAAAHAAALPQAQLVNEYGPTEVTVWSVAHRVDTAADGVADRVPIGQPIPFVDAHVLDDAMQPMPPGVTGELFLGGPALARGYLGWPALSAERFVPHPFATGERLYRTGDRVRLRADGRLDFLGRLDAQVKLRGHRVELGEVEARLVELAGVTAAAAIVREDQPGDQRLVAYVAAQSVSADALKAHLSRSLPEFLLPSAFVVLDALPLTPNGKIDRRALPAPADVQTQRQRVAPRTATESLLAAIWCDLLGAEALSVHDNFFELGGHSLLATQVATRVRRSFQIEMPVREIFAAPTIAGLAELVDGRRHSGQSVLDAPVTPLTPEQRTGELPLSFAQQRLWFLAQLEPDDPSYHIAGVLRMQGRLNATAWARAFLALQQHHEVLRSRFVAGREGRPVLQIAVEPLAALHTLDLSADANARAQADAFAQRDATQPFSLTDGPLVRARLLTLADDTHELVLVLHHIVSDGGATERLLQDWAALYAQAQQGPEAPSLSAPALQYADYAVWQRAQLTEAVQARELAHWRQVLGDEQPLLSLPTDRPRPPVLSGRGGKVQWRLPADLSRAVRQFANRHNATLFMLLEAAFAALLARYANQRDIRVGTPVSGRDRLELEPVVGLFVNTVVLRHEMAATESLASLLAQVRGRVLDATQHQQLPFERLVDALASARDLSHQPLFQAMFDLQTERYAALSTIPGVQASLAPIDTASSKFDLSLTCADDDVQISASFEYSSDLFDHTSIERIARRYEALLQAGLASPDRPLADLPLLAADEVRALYPSPQAPLPIGQGFAALFDAVVKSNGERIAVRDGGDTLSYRQLQQRARALAAALQAAGAAPDAPVAVLLPRSNSYLVAIVASLLAGCAWLPLDVSLPEARLVQMLAQARPPVLVAEAGAALTQAVLRVLAQPPHVVAPGATGDAPLRATPPQDERLAYVIYTSGSTGKPKGAMVSCAGMLNNLLGKIGQLQLTATDRIAQTASPCFDISVWQFLTALLCGARVEIVPDAQAKDAAALLQAVNERGITVLESVPSLMRGMLADPDAPGHLPTLRWLLPTGEALPPALASQWFERFAGVPLLNAYGPAECADDVALWRLDQAPAAELTHLPIGRAADNLRLCAVNDALQAQPAGAVGELLIGGIGVGRGYLSDPALTAERFVPDPFGPPGARCYRSGDLVRQSADGVFTFLGRRDHQVKVRGYRVEPGEVEARLLQHPGVQAVAVLLHGEPARLVAYVAGDAALEPQTLRRFVGQQLPDYMVPAVCVVLAGLPLNANGKLDRSRLPAPEVAVAAPGDRAAMTPVQAQLACVWAEVLGVATVGLHDNFFALGGDSILVIQVVAKARETGWKLSAKNLFLHQTIESLATVVEPLQAAIARPGPSGELPLTPIQHAFFVLHGERPHHWNQSVLLTPARPLHAACARAAVAALAERHHALRLRFTRDSGGWIQRYADTETTELFVESALAGEAALMPACDALQASLDVEHGPLWRVGLLSWPGGEQRLLLACHHLVVDGVSLRLLLDDLASAYEQSEREATIRLSLRTDSFQDWAQDLARRAGNGAFDAELPYWQAQVASALPVEQPLGSRLEGDADTVSVQLSPEHTARLLRCAEWHARPDDFLLTALAGRLAEWAGQPAVLVEMEGHGRPDHLDVSSTVGWFTAAYPLRLAVDTQAPAAEQLKAVKQALRAVPGGGVGHGALRHLSGRLASGVTPQVSFNYLGQFDTNAGQHKLWAALHANSGRLYDPQAPRPQEFDLNSYVVAGQLCVDWRFGTQRYQRATVQRLAQAFIASVVDLLKHAGGGDLLTPQDFPDAGLDDDALAQLLAGME